MIIKNKKDFAILTCTTRNLGDDIQGIAARQFLPECKYFVDRDKIGSEKRNLKLIGNGWWMWGVDFPPKDNIEMLPISMHISNRNIPLDWFRKNQPIGCRDSYTKKYLEANGIKAYFSGCLTLTFPLYEGERENRIIVVGEVPNWQELKIPDGMVIKEVFHWIKDEDLKLCNKPEERIRGAEKRLKIYRESKLVITNRMHVTLPCVAFGTPVILIRTEKNRDRLSGYDFIPKHKEINFDKSYLVKRPLKLIEDLKKRVNEFVKNEN